MPRQVRGRDWSDLTGDKTFSIKSAFRLPQTCSDGQSPKWDGGDEVWVCQQFVKPSTCSSGQFATGANSSGTISCAAPAATSLSNFDEVANDGGIPDDNAYHDFVNVTENLAGTYLLLAKGNFTSTNDVSDFRDADCAIRQNGTIRDEITAFSDTLDNVVNIPFSLQAVVTVFSGDQLQLSCRASQDADGVGLNEGRITGIRIGS